MSRTLSRLHRTVLGGNQPLHRRMALLTMLAVTATSVVTCATVSLTLLRGERASLVGVLVAGSVGIVMAGVLGRAVATAALRPVHRFTEAVRHVAETGDLHPVAPGRHPEGDLASLTETFNAMLVRLATSREQQNQLLADASHELRTPLTSVRTNVELLALDARRGRLSEDHRTQILDEVLAQTVELSAIIADLVHLNRERTVTLFEPVDLRAVVETAIEQVRHHATAVAFDVEATSLELLGDAARLEQAVTKLLDNAVRWSPEGSTVHVRLSGQQLRIADEGPGIAEIDLPHVFDRFYRADTARSTHGTGLGLAVAAKIIHDHRGTITAGRSPHGGAQLVVRLPGTPSAPSTVLDRLHLLPAAARSLAS